MVCDRFSQAHHFKKPNDMQALLLMNESAKAVVEDVTDIIFAYGVSDEYRSPLIPSDFIAITATAVKNPQLIKLFAMMKFWNLLHPIFL